MQNAFINEKVLNLRETLKTIYLHNGKITINFLETHEIKII